jgi:membrane protein
MADGRGGTGRAATRPGGFRPADWRAVLGRVWTRIGDHNLSLLAAGIAFWGTLALFPGVAAVVSVYGLFADPADIARTLEAVRPFLPADVYRPVASQLAALTDASTRALGTASLVSLLLALWSARNGVSAMVQGLNVVYREKDTRGIVVGTAVTVLLTLVLIAVVILALVALVVVPTLLNLLPIHPLAEWTARLARWPILAAAAVAGIAVLYRYGPHRENAKLRWISWGAAAAVALWLIASVLFSYYVSNVVDYNATYGSLGAIVVLLTWFYISAFVVLAGAELDAEMEMQTARDTTTGPEQPMGERGAYVADHVAD